MEEKTEITEDTVQDTEKEAGVHEETKENADQPALLEPLKLSGKAVGIEAHIKEVKEQEILISSDCDDFPGAFAVEVPESVFDFTADGRNSCTDSDGGKGRDRRKYKISGQRH